MVHGPRSFLVLLKLGFDLRSSYDSQMDAPLPEHLNRLVARLPGGERNVFELKPAPPLF